MSYNTISSVHIFEALINGAKGTLSHFSRSRHFPKKLMPELDRILQLTTADTGLLPQMIYDFFGKIIKYSSDEDLYESAAYERERFIDEYKKVYAGYSNTSSLPVASEVHLNNEVINQHYGSIGRPPLSEGNLIMTAHTPHSNAVWIPVKGKRIPVIRPIISARRLSRARSANRVGANRVGARKSKKSKSKGKARSA
jgi:hypothetical protein